MGSGTISTGSVTGGSSAPRGAATSVTRRPNSSSMTTTSPRAITRPLTSRSTGSPAMRCRPTTEPGPRARASPSVMRVRPISTETSTVTSVRRSGSPGSGALAAAGWRGAKSIWSVIEWLLLDGDVGEQDVVGLDVGLLDELAEDLLLEALAALAADQAPAGD